MVHRSDLLPDGDRIVRFLRWLRVRWAGPSIKPTAQFVLIQKYDQSLVIVRVYSSIEGHRLVKYHTGAKSEWYVLAANGTIRGGHYYRSWEAI